MKPKFTILFKKYFEILDGDFEDDFCSKSQAKICTGKIRNAINEIKGLISA